MVTDHYHPEPPFNYECVDCGKRYEAAEISDHEPSDELVECPECGGSPWNLTTPSHE